MSKFRIILLTLIIIITAIPGCKKKTSPNMVDMDNFNADGSHDDNYIFRKELEKEESRSKKYRKDKF